MNHMSLHRSTAQLSTMLLVVCVVFGLKAGSGEPEPDPSCDGRRRVADEEEWALVTNASVDWEITPGLDAVVLLNGQLEHLLRTSDRESVVSNCLAMLDNDERYLAGHAVLCQVFDRMDPSLEVLDARTAEIHLHSLRVHVKISSGGVWHKAVLVEWPVRQQESVRRYWEPLRRSGSDKFMRLHPPYRGALGRARAEDDAETIDAVREALAKGPTWVAEGLGTPAPVFSVLASRIGVRGSGAFGACMDALMRDESWIAAHLLLAQARRTDRLRKSESDPHGFDVNIDGLSIRVDVMGEERRFRVSYPRSDIEKHVVRYKWMTRVAEGKK